MVAELEAIFNLCLIDINCFTKAGARCWCRSWLRHYATSRKVAGSIPDSVIEIFL